MADMNHEVEAGYAAYHHVALCEIDLLLTELEAEGIPANITLDALREYLEIADETGIK